MKDNCQARGSKTFVWSSESKQQRVALRRGSVKQEEAAKESHYMRGSVEQE